ncbi:MAG: hypothetical protein JKX93_15595 [Rhizobiaceae bacterium]|nr:hypothetical protein [Rhizobiaceae bacterium]
MIKTILAGIWAAAVLSGSVWFFGQPAPIKGAEEDKGAYFGSLETVKLETIVVPIVRQSSVQGYIILESVYSIDTEEAASLSVPIQYILRDLINRSIYGNTNIDIYRLEKFDLVKFQETIVSDINAKLGKNIVHDVMIQRLNFMTKEEIRDEQLRRS